MSVEEVAPGVLVTTSRRDTTTTTVVVHGDEALLVDPAWDPDELAAIADLLDAHGLRVVAGVSTHAHHDHLLWHPRFGTAPRSRVAEPRMTGPAGVGSRERQTIDAYLQLPPKKRGLVGELVKALSDSA